LNEYFRPRKTSNSSSYILVAIVAVILFMVVAEVGFGMKIISPFADAVSGFLSGLT